jgi:hypothetical protein
VMMIIYYSGIGSDTFLYRHLKNPIPKELGFFIL